NTGDTTLNKIAQSGECALYEYKYPLPIGFAVENDFDTEEFLEYRPFHNQNELFTAMTGIDKPLFRTSTKMGASAQGGSVTGSNGSFRFTATTETITLSFRIDCETDGLYYVYPRIYGTNYVTINWGGGKTLFASKHSQAAALPAGYHNAGDTIFVTCSIDGDGAQHNAIMEYAVMDTEVFDEGYAKLSAGGMTEVTYTDTTVSGKVNAAEDTLLYTSIPYESGWRAYLDGELVEVDAYADAFVSINVPAGEHTVRFEYTPAGFNLGLAVSIVCISLCALSGWLYSRIKEKQEDEPPLDPVSEE
ncbi:MAG: YfhO family protein, partial [Clostridia bacterium]|nr:YfhO family protein [Clostridia bacterium]